MRLSVELVPATSWCANVRTVVTRREWELCKAYSKTKTDGVCFICGGAGRRWPTEAHEIWEYDDRAHVQTLVDIVPLCPTCHQCKHLGRTREVSSLAQWTRVIEHLQGVNEWDDDYTLYYVRSVFKTWGDRSQYPWVLDLELLRTLGIDPAGREPRR